MVRILSLNNPRLALAFVDYMATQGITLQVKNEGQDVQIWLEDESQLPQVEQQLALFLKDPLHSRYQAASWQAGKANVRLGYRSQPFWHNIRAQSGPLTLGMIILCVIVFVLQQSLGHEAVFNALSWPRDGSQNFELWRWFSPMLMHYSFLGLIINLVWWWYLGGQIEKHLGSGKLFTVTIVSALITGWGQSMVSGFWFTGLSGVVYALMGYAWLTGQLRPESNLYVPFGLLVFSLALLIISYMTGGAAVANAAHVFGLGLGLLMAFVDSRMSHKKQN